MPQLTLGNLETALSNIKGRRSAPGPGGVTYSMMENMPQQIATSLVATMQHRLQSEEAEEDPYASVTFIAKRKHPTTAADWRPITVANVKKVFELRLLTGTEADMENHRPPEELGFRPGRQAAYLLFVMHRVVANTRATG